MRKLAKYLALRLLPGAVLDRWVRWRAWRARPHVRGESTEAVFTDIKRKNLWHCSESLSGGGSTMAFTEAVRRWLPDLFHRLNVRTFIDIPCGDFAWMRHVPMDGIDYIGGDIVRDLVEANAARWGSRSRRFVQLDLARDPLPDGDLLLCKDCLVHLSHDLAISSIGNMRRANIRYVLLTSYPQQNRNVNILTGDTWRVNLLLPPFNLPGPLDQICEGTEDGMEKYLGLWARESLPC